MKVTPDLQTEMSNLFPHHIVKLCKCGGVITALVGIAEPACAELLQVRSCIDNLYYVFKFRHLNAELLKFRSCTNGIHILVIANTDNKYIQVYCSSSAICRSGVTLVLSYINYSCVSLE